MLFRRIAFIGIMLAAVSAAVIQVRLMNATASREIHLLVAQQQKLQRQIWQQEMELARLRTPQRITDRLASTGTDFLAPDAKRVSDLPPRSATDPAAGNVAVSLTGAGPAEPAGDAADGPAPSVPTSVTASGRHSGGSTQSWPSHPTHSNPRRLAR